MARPGIKILFIHGHLHMPKSNRSTGNATQWKTNGTNHELSLLPLTMGAMFSKQLKGVRHLQCDSHAQPGRKQPMGNFSLKKPARPPIKQKVFGAPWATPGLTMVMRIPGKRESRLNRERTRRCNQGQKLHSRGRHGAHWAWPGKGRFADDLRARRPAENKGMTGPGRPPIPWSYKFGSLNTEGFHPVIRGGSLF